MNTTYKPIDPEFLHMLAGAKARGLSWTQLAELTKIPVGELEVIPWREPQEWAKASKYAEKLVAHEVLAEMVSSLRFQMNDPVNNGRLKTQVANSLVRVVQLQHALRTPKQPPKKATRSPLEPLTRIAPKPPQPSTTEPVLSTPLADHPKPTPRSTPLATAAAVLLFVLVGLVGLGCGATPNNNETPFVTKTQEQPAHLEGWVGEDRQWLMAADGFSEAHGFRWCDQRDVVANNQQLSTHQTPADNRRLLPPPDA